MSPGSCVKESGPAKENARHLQAQSWQRPFAVNSNQTDDRIRRAAYGIRLGVPLAEVKAALRLDGASEEAVFLILAAAKILAS